MDRPDHEQLIVVLDDQIVSNPGRVIAVFVLLTAVFAGGMAGVSIDSGTERFLESVSEYHTQESVEDTFGSSFEAEESTTQVVITDENVFSKRAIIRSIELAEDLEAEESLRVTEVTGLGPAVGEVLAPFASTTAERRHAVETASEAEIREAVTTLTEQQPAIKQLVGEDRNLEEPRAEVTMLLVHHGIPEADQATLETVQQQVMATAETADGDVRVFGTAVQEAGFDRAIFESLALIVPLVGAFILLFLIVAYRDPIDLLLGLVSLFVAIIWTFGFMGYARIKFNLMMIAVPVLLLGVGIDFGIHAVNRYREERSAGVGIREGMSRANQQLLVAFLIVSGTNVIGFSANVTSALEPVREFGVVVSVGMLFTLFVFGIFMPALKVATDDFRESHGVREFSTTALGGETSRLGDLLRGSAHLAKEHPYVVVAIILVVTAGAGASATNVESKFETEDFLPYAEHPPQIAVLPEEISPSTFEITETSNYITDSFETTNTEQVTVYVEGPMERGDALESVYRMGADPPSSFVREDGRAVSESVLDVMDSYAAEDPDFSAKLDRNDLSANGVPDRHLADVYDALEGSAYADATAEYLTDDRRETKVVYQVEASATQREITEDARELAADARYDAVATGDTIVFRALTEALLSSAIRSFAVAFSLTAVFLVFIFGVLEGRPSLGVANMVPVTVAIVWLVGAMPLLGIAFNALTATILAITIGLGVAYSVHVTHRFIDEYDRRNDLDESLRLTLSGTGGGVTASMLTTAGAVLCMTMSVNPILGEFGLLTGFSTVFSYLAAVIVL
ncbi:MAG: efflux RND transporter permease subunit, partial [Halodesulfurarchaeum sp.]